MFVVGVELEASHLRGKAHTAVAVSHFSIVIPFILGVALSLALYGQYAPDGVAFHAFALFLGIAMSITAFPVLARMLEERRLTAHTARHDRHHVRGSRRCDGVEPARVRRRGRRRRAARSTKLFVMMGLSLLFVLLMLFVGAPAAAACARSGQRRRDAQQRTHRDGARSCSCPPRWSTEIIGIHALFGAFVAGAIMPTGGVFRRVLRERLESISSVFLLPLFFAYTGLRTQIGLLDDVASWAICLTIIVVATIGKLGGTAIAARWTGMRWRDSVALGALMNTRGLMELIALNVGYDLGILTPEIFAMMVLMALVTTAMTGPLLSLSLRWGRSRALAPSGPMARES